MKDIRFYLWVFRRRLPWFLATAALVTGLVLLMVMRMQPVYVSNLGLIVETPQTGPSVTRATVSTPAEEHLRRLRQSLLDRDNLVTIARKLGAVPEIDTLSDAEIADNMRARTSTAIATSRESATIMSVGFEAASGQIAAGVMAEYLEAIRRGNAAFRTSQASGMQSFVREEAERLGAEVEAHAARVLAFKNENAAALPEDLEYRMRVRATFQERLSQTERDLAALQEQRRRHVEFYERTGQISDSSVRGTPEQQQLATLRNELAAALVVMSPTNPRVRAMQARVAQLEQLVARQFGVTDLDAGASLLDLQLVELDSQISAASAAKTELETQITDLSVSIEATSRNSVQLTALQNDYNAALTRYNDALGRLAQADAGARIEQQSSNQNLIVTEGPTNPTAPARPNRRMLGVVGVLLGMFAGLSVVVVLELMNRTVRRPEDLFRQINVWPIATLPYIPARKYGDS